MWKWAGISGLYNSIEIERNFLFDDDALKLKGVSGGNYKAV